MKRLTGTEKKRIQRNKERRIRRLGDRIADDFKSGMSRKEIAKAFYMTDTEIDAVLRQRVRPS